MTYRKYPIYTKAEIEALPSITAESIELDNFYTEIAWDLCDEWQVKQVEKWGHRLLYNPSTGEVKEEYCEEYLESYSWEDIFYPNGSSVYVAGK